MRTRTGFFATVTLTLSMGLLLAGCGGTSTGGTSPTQPSPNSELSWSGSANGTYVLDANGTPYYFSASTGCMFGKNSNYGPQNFCLTPSTSQTSGYTYYGATGCPANDSACTTPTFDVVLTNNPSGAGCIAVLGNGSSNPTAIAGNITVVDTNGSFTIGGGTSATAYKTYWDGAIPICGGNSIYAGTYVSTTYATNGWLDIGGRCTTQVPAPTTRSGSLTLTIDSGGIIDSDTSEVIGMVGNPVNTTGALGAAVATGLNCTPMLSITSAAQNTSGKWVLTGSETLAGDSTPFTATEQ